MMGDHLHARQRRLLRRQLPHPADRPRPRPAQGGGPQVEAFTEAVDILPTVLDLLGGDVPAHLDGTFAGAVSRRRRIRPTGATPRIGSSISGRSSKAQGREAFRHRLAPMQSRRRAHGTIQIRAFRRWPAARAVRSCGRSGRDAERRRRPGLRSRAAGHGRTAARLAGRTSRPVAGAERADRTTGVVGEYHALP